MKKILLIAAILVGIQVQSKAQSKSITDTTFNVAGICDMCKDRIEDAAYIKGVKLAEWTQDSQTLRLVFKNSKTSLKEVQKRISEAGHAMPNFPETEEGYANLPDCCKFKTVDPH